jgi:decaprenylphospho-beta-D-erythro-pentofuranosid-2-ulose 2-reductase
MKRILILGATSAIASGTARLFALRGDRLCLVARDEKKLRAVAQDVTAFAPEGAIVHTLTADASRFEGHAKTLADAKQALGGVADIALIAYGSLSDQAACQRDPTLTVRELELNFLSVVSYLTSLANDFEAQGGGCIAVISSVAGDRGRQSNYVYGASKAALTAFLQGLRQRLSRRGVQVLTIKPGFVDTPMTAGVKKNLLFAKPGTVAAGIVAAIDNGKDEVYLPGFWRWIMLAIRWVPERIFKRLKM